MSDLVEAPIVGEPKILMFRMRDHGEPTPAQADSGNYAKGRVQWNGLVISIENPAGSVRRGIARDGTAWEVPMRFDYGYVRGSMGVDGDQVDVYLGPNLLDAPAVYVVHQNTYGDWGKYDEDKCMLGFLSEDDACAAFLLCYDDPRFLGPITTLPVAEFVAKVRATKRAPAMIKGLVLFAKAHVQSFTRRDGSFVREHDDGRAPPPSPAQVEATGDPEARGFAHPAESWGGWDSLSAGMSRDPRAHAIRDSWDKVYLDGHRAPIGSPEREDFLDADATHRAQMADLVDTRQHESAERNRTRRHELAERNRPAQADLFSKARRAPVILFGRRE